MRACKLQARGDRALTNAYTIVVISRDPDALLSWAVLFAPAIEEDRNMARPSAALAALVFATVAVAAAPAWADRRGSRFDRGHPVHESGHQSHSFGHRDHRDRGWIVGLGLLAGTAILLAATEPRQVTYSTPVRVYSPPPPPLPVSIYANPANQWWYYCTQPAGYYPYVQQCPAGWIQVSPRPPG